MRRCACTFNYRSFNENLYQDKKNRDLHNTEFFLIKTIFKNLPVPVPDIYKLTSYKFTSYPNLSRRQEIGKDLYLNFQQDHI